MVFNKMVYKRKFRKSKPRRRVGRRRGGLKALISRILMKRSETKFYETGASAVVHYHNAGASAGAIGTTIFNPWSNITQGTGQYGRIGDSITPIGSKWVLHIQNQANQQQNFMFRVLLVVMPKTLGGNLTTTATSPFDANYFNSITAMVDPSSVKVLYDKVYNIQPGTSNCLIAGQNNEYQSNINSKYVKFYVKSKRGSTLKYEQANNGQLLNRPVALFIFPYAYDGLSTSQALCNIDIQYRLYFKDI